MPSHYCRESSNLLYLSADLMLTKMYVLYTSHSQEKKLQPLSCTIYRKTFKSMNLAFHSPEKDRCETCERFCNLSPQEQEEEKVTYQQHRQRAEKIRAIKSHLKKEADKNKLNAVFDLQKALTTLKSEVSLFYYARKLLTYNLSITDLTNDEITCFVWHEDVSARGSNEIGSCLLYMLQKWDEQGGIKEVNFFSAHALGKIAIGTF